MDAPAGDSEGGKIVGHFGRVTYRKKPKKKTTPRANEPESHSNSLGFAYHSRATSANQTEIPAIESACMPDVP
jgi:hypothetical protein